MPYGTQNGVRIYSDRDTPPEFASGADEERHIYNEAQARAFKCAEELATLIDRAHGDPQCSAVVMGRLADSAETLLDAAKWIFSVNRRGPAS